VDFKLANFVLHLRLKVEYLQTKTNKTMWISNLPILFFTYV